MTRGTLAQSKYPERPIRLVIPFVPGGVTDAVGRQWAHAMTALLGPVFIENQGGGGGAIGAAAVARAEPDGYSLLFGSTPNLVVIPIAGHAQYDPARDFAPISILGDSPAALLINPSLSVHNLNELVAYSKANPGRLSYGSPGAGTMSHLAGELFKSLTGTNDIVHVPYKGAGPATVDLISGQIPMVLLGITSQAIELHRSGKVTMLAVASPARMIAAPDIPTAVEQGLPGLIAQTFYGLFAPAGTPKAIIAQISNATRTAMADAEFRENLIASGFEPYLDSSPEAAQRLVDEAVTRWTPVIKTIGLKLGSRRQGGDIAMREPGTISRLSNSRSGNSFISELSPGCGMPSCQPAALTQRIRIRVPTP
jgi:tripartite-type tricarboxylate transporter receptor subunit TctC